MNVSPETYLMNASPETYLMNVSPETYLMKVSPETPSAHYIRYLRFYSLYHTFFYYVIQKFSCYKPFIKRLFNTVLYILVF
jgi:hypothetical protein